MAKILDARAAAHEIRGKLKQPEAEDRHVMAFVEKVLDELHLEHNATNSVMVARALHDADIQPHQIQEYPKAVTVKVRDKKRFGDDEEHDVTHVVHDEDEEAAVTRGDEYVPGQPEYPKTIQVRGTDGHMHPQIVRDLKEEREFLGVDEGGPIAPEASSQFKKNRLERPTEDELNDARRTDGGAMQREALDKANEPKVGAGTNVAGRMIDDSGQHEEFESDEAYLASQEPVKPVAPAPAPARTGPRPPPKRV